MLNFEGNPHDQTDKIAAELLPEHIGIIESSSSHNQLQKIIALGGAVLAFATGAELASSPKSEAYSSYDCSVSRDDPRYSTICEFPTKKSVEVYCAEQATYPPYELKKSNFLTGSHSQYKIHFTQGDIHGCDPAGKHRMTFYTKLKESGSDTYVRNSAKHSVTSTYDIKVNKIVAVEDNCGPDSADSKIVTEVKETWIPRKGWGVNHSTTKVYDSPPRDAC